MTSVQRCSRPDPVRRKEGHCSSKLHRRAWRRRTLGRTPQPYPVRMCHTRDLGCLPHARSWAQDGVKPTDSSVAQRQIYQTLSRRWRPRSPTGREARDWQARRCRRSQLTSRRATPLMPLRRVRRLSSSPSLPFVLVSISVVRDVREAGQWGRSASRRQSGNFLAVRAPERMS